MDGKKCIIKRYFKKNSRSLLYCQHVYANRHCFRRPFVTGFNGGQTISDDRGSSEVIRIEIIESPFIDSGYTLIRKIDLIRQLYSGSFPVSRRAARPAAELVSIFKAFNLHNFLSWEMTHLQTHTYTKSTTL